MYRVLTERIASVDFAAVAESEGLSHCYSIGLLSGIPSQRLTLAGSFRSLV